jgi:hyperosmotically inducible protein
MGSFAAAAYGAVATDAIQREVRHELVMLPRYGVFDFITYRVDGTQVTLSGQVTQPYIKDDAEKAVKGIEGVTKVNDQIEVLPLSPMDDGIRRAVFRAIYADPAMTRYSFYSVATIHIIVKNGNVTLEGAVASAMDKEIAGIRANSIPGIFAVVNNLRVDGNIG